MYCNVCGNNAFGAFSGRMHALCQKCKSTERHRLLVRALFNSGIDLTKIDASKILMLNGNEELNQKLKNFFLGNTLVEKSVSFPISLTSLADGYDLILHSHFLNNVNCDWRVLLNLLILKLNPSGKMFFTVPVDVAKASNDSDRGVSNIDYGELKEVGQGTINKDIKLDHLAEYLRGLDGKFLHLKYPERELLEISAIGVDVFSFVKY